MGRLKKSFLFVLLDIFTSELNTVDWNPHAFNKNTVVINGTIKTLLLTRFRN